MRIFSLYVLFMFLVAATSVAQPMAPPKQYIDTSFMVKKRPVRAAIGVIGLNTTIWAFDRYLLQGDYAYISSSTIKKNFKTGMMWDTDNFSTNLLFHPLHGSYYFHIARSNNLNFWESTPYVLGGSLMWEFIMENQPASINDLFSTTAGGIALGEISFRLSSNILDDSKTGLERVMRELCAAVVSPMRALNRLTCGELTRRRSSNSYQREQGDLSVQFSSGCRYLSDKTSTMDDNFGMFADLQFSYGNPYAEDRYRPYEYFTSRVMLNMISNQTLVGNINAMGMLWGISVQSAARKSRTIGIFQHFDYYQTNVGDRVNNNPFEIAQTAAFGLGVLSEHKVGSKSTFTYNLHANATLMGGGSTNYFNKGDRNYNLGSGYNLKLQTELNCNNRVRLSLDVEHYHLFTWKGYANEPNPIPPNTDLNYLNVQGNVGNTIFIIINPCLNVKMSNRLSASFDTYLYHRNSVYLNFTNVIYQALDARLSLAYNI